MSDKYDEGRQASQEWARLGEDTERAEVYCHEDHKTEWKKEAKHEGQSLSRYLYDLVQEARAYREGGLPLIASKDERVEELQSRIEELQDELSRAQEEQSGRTRITVDDLTEEVLTDQYQTLDELLEDVKATEDVSDHLRRCLEERLYSLAEDKKVEFQRGHGWRFAEGE
ncbi:hypothetical protein [Natronorubrum daqingense]|uniref:Uncharacterized protein n=1 Tax=Natronorubrum daqingense TaxID=588898 RepID=A0A1N6ZCQ4_9EURY|nr:hypothetical protein [Natronorubrum daqingense]APX95389.1 hypothetical protein BB347_01480 [Natronorubrum daqingense]SIR24584.1 hypothetical protein SAMN05421809_0761 [Natronorubrum daqingense]